MYCVMTKYIYLPIYCFMTNDNYSVDIDSKKYLKKKRPTGFSRSIVVRRHLPVLEDLQRWVSADGELGASFLASLRAINHGKGDIIVFAT